MPKVVWRVKLVAELRPGVMTETEVARLERDEQVGLAEFGLGERRRSCAVYAACWPARAITGLRSIF